MFIHQKLGGNCRGNFINWRLFQILFLLQNCLILQIACSHSGNSHGLLRSSNNGIFLPINNTREVTPSDPKGDLGVGVAVTALSPEVSNPIVMSTSEPISISSPAPVEEIGNDFAEEVEKVGVTPPEPEDDLEDEYEEEDTNKSKRSKGYIKRLLRRLGLSSRTQEPPREREFEAQMADDGGMDTATTAPGSSFLSKLNPINKISYKINTARNVVNRALNVVGLGSKPAPADGSGGADEGGQGDEGSTRDAAATGDDADSGSGGIYFRGNFFGGVWVTIGVLLMGWKMM